MTGMIGQYSLVSRCGHGAYGEVFQATDLSGRIVALKRIYKNQYNLDWKREFDGLINYCHMNLKAPNLIEVYHIDENDDYFYYTMEIADNLNKEQSKFIPDTLGARLNNGFISSREAVSITIQILDGLKVLHDHNLVHRDIKPENIVFINNIPKLSDIGLVALSDTTRSLAGTMGYLPPEIVIKAMKNGIYKFTAQSDLYAIGKVLYCMITGNTPDKFPSFPLPIAKQDGMKLINQILGKACNKNARLRYVSASEFQDSLSSRSINRTIHDKCKLFVFIILLLLLAISLGYVIYRQQETRETPLHDKAKDVSLQSQKAIKKQGASSRKKIIYPQSGSFSADNQIDDNF